MKRETREKVWDVWARHPWAHRMVLVCFAPLIFLVILPLHCLTTSDLIETIKDEYTEAFYAWKRSFRKGGPAPQEGY